MKYWQPSKEDVQFLNVGTGIDLSIRDLAKLVAEVVGFKGLINWDVSKPDGTPKKQLDVTYLSSLGWKPKITLKEGVAATGQDFIQKYMHSRQFIRNY